MDKIKNFSRQRLSIYLKQSPEGCFQANVKVNVKVNANANSTQNENAKLKL